MSSFPSNIRRYFQRLSAGTLIVIAVLVLGRVALPPVLVWYVNRTLQRIPDYTGSISDVDVALIRGAYTIMDLKLLKRSGSIPTPFFSAKETDLSIEWRALLEGKLVGEINLFQAELNFVQGPSKTSSQTGISDEWLKVVKDLFPLRINRFEAHQSSIHFRNLHSSPKVDVVLSQLEILGSNLSNSRSPSSGLTATIDAHASVEGKAPLTTRTRLDPSAAAPRFETELAMKSLPLTSLNDYLRAYGGFDAEGGTLELYGAASARNGKLSGEIKPLAHEIKIFKSSSDDESTLGFLWEALVGALSEIFENQRHQQIGTVISFEGDFDKPKTSYLEIFSETVKNAFFRALKPGIDPPEASEPQK